jgi:hypothetical protein
MIVSPSYSEHDKKRKDKSLQNKGKGKAAGFLRQCLREV